MYCPYCGTGGCFGRFCGSCGSNIECLAPFLEDVTESNEGIEAGLIHKYFTEGHAYEVILDFLEKRHNIVLSLRTLKRRLQNAGLTRTDYTPIGTVHQTVAHELRGSGRLLGYRAMWQTLQQKYHLTVKREDVRQTISRLDPSGVQLRSRRRFVRRGYVTAGPNQVWHADGYDKLKPFGIAISGCIDGFSRKVMWLRSGSTNNDPGIIAQYYLQCVSEFGLLPARLRTDCGTENGTMAAINCTLRSQHTDDFAGALSHMYGTSTANQRIESWWSFFRKQRTQFWIELFSDLRERHLFNGSHEHKCLLRYVFLGILQKDLDEYRQLWNNHTIRPVRLSQCPSGKPDAMYHLPHRFGGRECGFPVSWEALHHFDGIMQASSQYNLCGDENLEMHFVDLQRRSGLAPPVNWTAAVQNYISMKNISGV
ncbi:uncharacterized protein LOC117561334 isoform X2 [Gymnodraco acuticeps]|uniref:Uncharacterized protein LOC117561334 isoform X2 n=2 Tax=Gymnodraco acuticeps TaxID=8218 RepID=A0A6P8W6V5_GYMAC|nr:uncharacterized protein LOC117561334 isoform X2 [Gymnodraco acuticeps]